MLTSYTYLKYMMRQNKVNFVNNYSYDMMMSNYEMTTMLFPSRKFGVLANVVGTAFIDT